MNYAVEMGSGAICVPSLIMIASGIQKLIWGIQRHADSMVIAYAYFHFFKISKIG
jgi:hypothetical protein